MLKHILGSKMGKADSLSRRPDWKIGVEKDNEDEMLVKPEWLEVRKTEAVEIIVDGVDLLEEVRKLKVVTNFIWPYLHQFFDDSHGLKTSLKPLKRPFDRY